MTLDWSKYPNFTATEFRCRYTGKCLMRPEFMETLQQIRKTFARPLVITSGYRDPSHPAEAAKKAPGEHTYGVAADILISGDLARQLVHVALEYGIRRIGVAQDGRPGAFIHIGMGDRNLGFPPSLWSYPRG